VTQKVKQNVDRRTIVARTKVMISAEMV